MSAILPESINTENQCDAADAWGEEDAIQGNGSCVPQFFIPGSLQWDAYQVGYTRGKQLIQTLSEYDPDAALRQYNAISAPLPADRPGLWGLRGYEDALFNRPIRSKLPPARSDRTDYHAGYKKGAEINKSIMAAAPPGRRHTIRNF